MKYRIQLQVLPQPDDSTCGPTCLQSVYRYLGRELPLQGLIDEVPTLDHGGTLAVLLGTHALRNGYQERIYTLNLPVVDPSWFDQPGVDLAAKLRAQLEHQSAPKLQEATRAYLEFIEAGGELRFQTLNGDLLRYHLKRNEPILTGLSSTFLYGSARESIDAEGRLYFDDLGGSPQGHFVVLCGYDTQSREIEIADPYQQNPLGDEGRYHVPIDKLLNSVLLGALTFDANLLVVRAKKPAAQE